MEAEKGKVFGGMTENVF